MSLTEPVPRQLSLSVRLDDSATFDNFYIAPTESGAANAYAIGILKSCKQGDFIYLLGNRAGCSHLLQACCHWFSEKSVYLPLKQFVDENPADVLAGLEQMPMVILDGLNDVVGHAGWAEQLFHLYNRVQENNGCLVVSAKAPPKALETPLADLQSRLSAMQVHRVESLEDAEKSSALIQRAANRGMNMPESVAQYLLTHYSRDMGDLIQRLEQLDKASLEAKRKLSIPLVKEVLDNKQSEADP